jgi:hypothetical protein
VTTFKLTENTVELIQIVQTVVPGLAAGNYTDLELGNRRGAAIRLARFETVTAPWSRTESATADVGAYTSHGMRLTPAEKNLVLESEGPYSRSIARLPRDPVQKLRKAINLVVIAPVGELHQFRSQFV